MRSSSHLSDQQLIHLFKEGYADALEILVLRHKEKLYTSIYLLVKDRHLAIAIRRKESSYPGQ